MKLNSVKKITVFFLLSLLVRCSPETPTEGAAEIAIEPASLENSAWQLVKIQSLGDYVFTPADPALYTLRFRLENRLIIKSDCNTGGATWVQNSNQLTFEEFVSTRAMCTPGTLHNRFISQLISTQSFQIRDNHLFLSEMTPGAYLEFEPIQ